MGASSGVRGPGPGASGRAGRQTRGDRTIEAVLDSALRLFGERGLEGFTIHALREESQVSLGSIYHHFGNRDGIVAALFFEIFHDQSRSVQAQLDAAQGVEAGVHALVTGYLDWVVAQPERARFLFQARGAVAASPRTPDLAEAARRRNQALVQETMTCI